MNSFRRSTIILAVQPPLRSKSDTDSTVTLMNHQKLSRNDDALDMVSDEFDSDSKENETVNQSEPVLIYSNDFVLVRQCQSIIISIISSSRSTKNTRKNRRKRASSTRSRSSSSTRTIRQ